MCILDALKGISAPQVVSIICFVQDSNILNNLTKIPLQPKVLSNNVAFDNIVLQEIRVIFMLGTDYWTADKQVDKMSNNEL